MHAAVGDAKWFDQGTLAKDLADGFAHACRESNAVWGGGETPALKGIVKDQSGYIALLLGTDGKSYFARVGQRFFDGVLVAMDAASATFRQEVTDPLSPVKTRDVKKSLYSSEEARQ